VLTATTPQGERCGPYEIPMELPALLDEARRGGFWSYVAGVAYQVASRYPVGGLVLDNYRTDLPIKKGLSSSAAICVLTARAFNRLYGLELSICDEMELAYQGEITTPSRCGRMDQGCAFGRRPVLMTFDGDHLETAALRPGRDLFLVVVDLHAQKDTMQILASLNSGYPFAETEVQRGVQELLGPINRRIVHQAVEALQAGDAERLGALMVEAQAAFDRYAMPACPEQLAAPILHRVLGYAPLQPHVWGGKGVGSQGDGSAQFIARSEEDQQAVADIVARELGLSSLAVTLRAGQPVRKAVIPAAGLGTRLFPASRAVKKEMFPIVDRDGIAKPVLLMIAEEALQSGIEELILVVQRQDVDGFRAFFDAPVPAQIHAKLPPNLKEYARQLNEMGERISYVVQHQQEGFGHAVYAACDAVGDEPFLLLLGDHLYRERNGTRCARQLIEAYHAACTGIVGLQRTPEAEIGKYGTVGGEWIEAGRLLRIQEFAEKPSVAHARARLQISHLPAGEYLTLFGQYVLTPRLFELLDAQIRRGQRENGEFQLTSALEQLRREEGFLGLMIDGHAYDVGVPELYIRAVSAFSE
jgi:UTP-glucose-1-phosphate uridylyltransferase